MGWGGARTGSGPKTGGAAQIRRDIDNAIQAGFAHAAATKHRHLATGNLHEDAKTAVAMVVSDAILAGDGLKVLAVWSQFAPKSDKDQGGDAGKTALETAIGRLGGLNTSEVHTKSDNEQVKSTGYGQRTTDSESAGLGKGPFFLPQLPFDLPSQDAPQATPGTPPAAPTPTYPVGAKNFDYFPNSDSGENT
ncbi:MAG: hypothetical protein OEZ43_20945 [Gammaproteobacteria bacterium]|nr:hypothetical protein [Gammaproteobacteria bacterium]